MKNIGQCTSLIDEIAHALLMRLIAGNRFVERDAALSRKSRQSNQPRGDPDSFRHRDAMKSYRLRVDNLTREMSR